MREQRLKGVAVFGFGDRLDETRKISRFRRLRRVCLYFVPRGPGVLAARHGLQTFH